MTYEELNQINVILKDGTDESKLYAANLILSYSEVNQTIHDPRFAEKLIYEFAYSLMDENDYLSAATLLLGFEKFDPRPKTTQMLFEQAFKSSKLAVPGASSCSKSYSFGVWLIIDWLRDPHYTKVRAAAVNAAHLKRNLFADMIDCAQQIQELMPDFNIEIKDMYIGLKGDNVGSNCIKPIYFSQDSTKSSGSFKGEKPTKRVKRKGDTRYEINKKNFGEVGRLRFILDECQNLPYGVYLDFSSGQASISGVERIKYFAPGNPEDLNHWWGKLCEPEKGFEDVDLNHDFQWVSKLGWDVLRLDAMMSENVIEKREVYSGIQTWEGFKGILKNGDNSAQYFTFCRGWFPVNADVNTVIKRKHVVSNIAEVIYAHGYENVGAVDVGKKDKTVLCHCKWGLASGIRYSNGDKVMFTDPDNDEAPRHLLQVQQFYEIDSGDYVDIYKKIKETCETIGIMPNWLAVDSTGVGDAVYDLLYRYFGNVLALQWGSKATEYKITEESKQLPVDTYDGLMSEMWYAGAQWFENGFVKIHPIIKEDPLIPQLTTRRIPTTSRSKGGKLRVESKAEYKSRGNNSPDESDSLLQCIQLVRQRSGVLPGVFREGTVTKVRSTELPPSIYEVKALGYKSNNKKEKKFPWEK